MLGLDPSTLRLAIGARKAHDQPLSALLGYREGARYERERCRAGFHNCRFGPLLQPGDHPWGGLVCSLDDVGDRRNGSGLPIDDTGSALSHMAVEACEEQAARHTRKSGPLVTNAPKSHPNPADPFSNPSPTPDLAPPDAATEPLPNEPPNEDTPGAPTPVHSPAAPDHPFGPPEPIHRRKRAASRSNLTTASAGIGAGASLTAPLSVPFLVRAAWSRFTAA